MSSTRRVALFAHVMGAVALGAHAIVCLSGDRVQWIPVCDLSVTHLIARVREWASRPAAGSPSPSGCWSGSPSSGHTLCPIGGAWERMGEVLG